jgi:ABC-2 type transport system ATP-binding protein
MLDCDWSSDVCSSDLPVAEFSKGMQRRIGLAQSLISDPELVILDEPTTGLDPIGTREIKDLILELKAKGKTVLLSSHLLADVEDVCDRVAILYGGRVRACGPMRELLCEERLTQVTAAMDAETLAEVKAVIQRRCGAAAPVEVGRPQQSLERFFLRVVEEARSQRAQTSGADASRGTLEFLSQAPGPDLLSRLAQPDADSASAPAAAPGPAAAAPLARNEPAVLSTLTRVAEAGAAATPAAEAPAPAAPPPNRNVLDKLVQGED